MNRDRALASLVRLARLLSSAACAATVIALPLVLAACTPNIGDKCQLSTDCAISGGRICDTSQPNGYCTILNCIPNSCPGGASCVLFQPSVPGCGYDDYHSPSRTGVSFCMAQCDQDSKCRQGDGYVCADPRKAPWNAAIIDDNQSQRVCIVAPDQNASPPPDAAAVCSRSGADAGTADAGAPDGAAPNEAGPADGSVDASDGGVDSGGDADSGSADAVGGG
jgi:hypothetical protein